MDFLIQTARYSIELHGHAMAFHVTASVLQGTPSLLHGTPWNSMDFHEFHGGISREVAETPATDPVTVVVG